MPALTNLSISETTTSICFYFFLFFVLHAIINALGARKAILHQHDIEISISISMFPNDTKVLVDVPMLSPPKSMHFKVEVFKT